MLANQQNPIALELKHRWHGAAVKLRHGGEGLIVIRREKVGRDCSAEGNIEMTQPVVSLLLHQYPYGGPNSENSNLEICCIKPYSKLGLGIIPYIYIGSKTLLFQI